SLYYIVCAIVVKTEDINILEAGAEKIRLKNGFQSGEMKSSLIGDNHKRRIKILIELLGLDFSLVILIADKQKFHHDSPLTNYKEPFVKYLHQKLYDEMYAAYPKLKIVEDEYGDSEFQSRYRDYIHTHRPQLNLLNEYDFDYVNSIHSSLVQIADVIAGSIMHHLMNNSAPDVLRIFQSRIRGLVNFPSTYPTYLAGIGADKAFDDNIYLLAEQRATQYIDSNKDTIDEDARMRVLFLKYLLWVVRNISHDKYISSGEIINVLSDLSNSRVRRDYLYRKIIAPLRDAGVIIASCLHGYKIPVCIEDIYLYINQTTGVVGPMLSRVEKCRQLILAQTDGSFDVLDDPALKKYKRYFGDY
ncbi:MAG: DUF3800 domain-containing protein, partial [Dysgonamonadaceae bacterium]|nr:DUF3800 domain-containing protein [Dysgonamonadaceae bacterium]